MAIRVSHTPYGAIGGLAEHAGQAQQAIRDQQIREQVESQARSIAAQKEMQAMQIGASREEWQRKLETQQEQFAMDQALQQEQIFRQQQASEFATMRNAQVAETQIATQKKQYEQNLALKQQQVLADTRAREQAFSLQEAQEERLSQSVQANIRAQEVRGAFDFKKLEVAKGSMAENLARWKDVQGVVSPEEYTAGTIAISQGKIPQISAGANALIDEKRQLDIEKKKLALAAGLTDRGRTVAQEVFKDVFGGAAGGIAGAWTGMSEAGLIDNYKSYQTKTGYAGKNDASKRELDNVFDRSIIDYENKGWFDYYSAWDPESKAVKNLRVQSKGVIGKEEAGKYITRVRRANPNATDEDIKAAAMSLAIKEGWKLSG
jgi:hypothetical protein